jgi:hypothetical protein
MKSKILGIALFGLTVAAVVYYPQLQARNIPVDTHVQNHIVANEKPIVDVVFVLDTTGSMSGLIQTAMVNRNNDGIRSADTGDSHWTGCLSGPWRRIRDQGR